MPHKPSVAVFGAGACRTWALIWGGVLMIFAFVPTFRHFRVLNVIALIGTTYTALLVFVLACKNGFAPASEVPL